MTLPVGLELDGNLRERCSGQAASGGHLCLLPVVPPSGRLCCLIIYSRVRLTVILTRQDVCEGTALPLFGMCRAMALF